MQLIRELVGAQLRAHRKAQGMTLRDLSANANVALGHLSEVERGRKEASSELIAALCAALGMSTSALLERAAGQARREELLQSGLTSVKSDQLAA